MRTQARNHSVTPWTRPLFIRFGWGAEPRSDGDSPVVGWVDLELVLVSVAAMLSPTTLTFSVLALVLAERPLRTGIWFYLGAFSVTIAIGVLAAFVLAARRDTLPQRPRGARRLAPAAVDQLDAVAVG